VLGSRYEIEALRADRRAFPAEVAVTRVDVPGTDLFAVSLRDITKRNDREERLREAEAKYRTLVEQIPLATYVNETGLPVRTRYISPQIESMLGYPVSAWLEPDFFPSRLHPEDRDRVMAEADRTHRTGESFRAEYRLVGADGRVVWVLDETSAVRDDEYRPLFLQGFLLDITERRAADEAVRRSEELYRFVVESSSDLVVLLDFDGTVRYASPSVERLLGWSEAELVGKPWAANVHPDDLRDARELMARRAAGDSVSAGSARVRHADGHWVLLEGTTSVLRDDRGEATGLVTVSRPVRQLAAVATA
jgi:PAS domain S-box-containing protein